MWWVPLRHLLGTNGANFCQYGETYRGCGPPLTLGTLIPTPLELSADCLRHRDTIGPLTALSSRKAPPREKNPSICEFTAVLLRTYSCTNATDAWCCSTLDSARRMSAASDDCALGELLGCGGARSESANSAVGHNC